MAQGDKNEQHKTFDLRNARFGKIRKIEAWAGIVRQRRNPCAQKRQPRSKRIVRQTHQNEKGRQGSGKPHSRVFGQGENQEPKPRRKTKIHTQSRRRLYACKTACGRKIEKGQARLTRIVFKNGIMRDFAHIHTLSCVFDGIKCVLCKYRLFSHIDCRHKTHRIFCDFTALPHSKYAARNHTKRKVSHLIIFCRFCKTERKILCDLRRFLTYKSDVCPTSQIFFLFNH